MYSVISVAFVHVPSPVVPKGVISAVTVCAVVSDLHFDTRELKVTEGIGFTVMLAVLVATQELLSVTETEIV